jgi:hypothetical protein
MTFLFMVNLFSHEAITKPSITHLNQKHEKCWLHLQIELDQLLVPINSNTYKEIKVWIWGIIKKLKKTIYKTNGNMVVAFMTQKI